MSNKTASSSPEVGQIAPNFQSVTQSGQKVDLYQILESGKRVLLVFYPGDMTPGCTAQLCGIRDVYSDYTKYGVKVLGVNHAGPESHQQFIDQYGFPFDILVDKDKEIINLYGATKSFYGRPTIKRGVFLIDTNKTIIYRFWGQQDNQKVLQILADRA
jgi:peroxiredoxin Q/BCP